MIAAAFAALATCVAFGLLAVVVLGRKALSDKRGEVVRRRLDSLATITAERRDVIRRVTYSEVPWFHTWLSRMNWARSLRRLISEAKAPGSPGVYVLLGMALWMAGFYAVLAATGWLLLAVPVALPLFYLPFAWLRIKRGSRMAAFQRQLPDALDLIARALKAGHTFEGGLRMAADEFGDPIGTEFGQTLDEINFGIHPEEALLTLINRVDCPDLKFFVVSVNIQRETGGNLAEIIGNIAHLVRERFKLNGRVRVLSAEGRLSAMILLALPFLIAVVINFLNPTYMSELVTTPIGKIMIAGALTSMAFGALVIRRMIRIKV